MRIVGFIPARGGSKGIPRKNLVPLGGRPLLSYAIDAARASALIDRVVVSTDDAEIADVAAACGAEVVIRPASLAADGTTMVPVVLHVLEVLAGRGYRPGLVVTLHPTSPFRSSALIDRAIREVIDGGAERVISVHGVNPRIGGVHDGLFQPEFDPESPEPVYVDAGAVYVNRAEELIEKRSYTAGRARAVIVDRIEGFDLNTPLDLAIAECIVEHVLAAR